MLLTDEYDIPNDSKASECWKMCYVIQRKELEDIGVPMDWNEEIKAALLSSAKDMDDKQRKIVQNFMKKVKTVYGLDINAEQLERAQIHALAENLNASSPVAMYNDFVKEFLKSNPLYYDTKTKMFWLWNKTEAKWEISDEIDILRIFNERYNVLEWIIPSIRMKIIDTLKVFAAKKPKDVPLNFIQFKAKVYDMNTETTMEANPEYFFTTPIPHDLGDSESTPTIDKLFGEWVADKTKERDIRALYETAAYTLYPAYPIQRVFVMHGEGANGKSTYLNLLRKLLGNDNTTASDYDRLADPNQRFERVGLFNKLMCQMGEIESKMMEKTSTLKELTSGKDLIRAEYKGKNHFEFVNFAKIIIATNRLPITADKSDGFYRRFNIIDFPHQFQDTRDIIAEIPEAEYPNMLRKCVRILKELLAAGKFINDGTIEDRAMRYEALSNPIKKFIEDNYELDPNGYVLKPGLKEAFNNYLKNNRMVVMNDKEITRALNCCGYVEKVKKIGNDTHRVVFGIKIREIDEKVTDVTEITAFPNYMPHIGHQLENSVTSVTSVTKNDILSYFRQVPEFHILEVTERFGEDSRPLIEQMLKNGELFEPQAGILKIV